MKMILNAALMAATIAGAAAFVPATANAQIGITLGIGGPGPVFSPDYAPCGSGYGPCGDGYNPYEGEYYYDPIFFDGSWYHGPYRWRMSGGERVYWINGGWHRNEWTGGAYPGSIAFGNGGYYRGGRYEGFDDADRINARFHRSAAAMRNAHPEGAPDRGNMSDYRGNTGGNRQGSPGPDDHHDGADGPHN